MITTDLSPAREYNAAVRYHKDVNVTMIRNWVGQTGDEEFFEACDKYGIVLWQDFWLANPVDGPEPNSNDLFLRNAGDMLLCIRNHPSVGLYCGRNEGDPPKPIDDGLRSIISKIHNGFGKLLLASPPGRQLSCTQSAAKGKTGIDDKSRAPGATLDFKNGLEEPIGTTSPNGSAESYPR